MENSTGSNNKAAEMLAQVLEGLPTPLKSLKLDHNTLVAKLEALMPFIQTFTASTSDLMEKGKYQDTLEKMEHYAHKFAEALNISTEDSFGFCFSLAGMTMVVKRMGPILAPWLLNTPVRS